MPRSVAWGGCSRSGRPRRAWTAGRRGRGPGPVRAGLLRPVLSRRPGRLRGGRGGTLGVVRRGRSYGAGAGLGRGAVVRAVCRGGRRAGAVAVRGACRRGRHRTGQAARHRLLDAARELMGLGQVLVGQQLGEAPRVALADGAHLPGVLSPVELQRDDGGLGVQAGDGVAGDLVAVEAGDRDEGGCDGPEPDRARPADGQGEQHADAVYGVRHGVEVHGEAVVCGGLAGDFQARQGGAARVGHLLDAVDGAVLVAERGPGHDRCAGRDPDLETGPGKRVVLSPRQLGRHRLPPVSLVSLARLPQDVVRESPVPRTGPAGWCRTATGPAGSPASGPGRCGRWPGCRWRSWPSPGPRGAPWP